MVILTSMTLIWLLHRFLYFINFLFALFSASCGGSVVIPINGSRIITSPNYPEPYPSQIACDWTVVAPRGHYINAT